MPLESDHSGCSLNCRGWLAIVEVVVVFALVHVSYRTIKQFTVIGGWESHAGTNFTPGVVMIVFTVGLVWPGRRDFGVYGLTLDRWREYLSLGLLCTVVGGTCGVLGFLLSGYAFDPSRPPDPHASPAWTRLGIVSAFFAAGLLLMLAMVASPRRFFRGLPATVSIPCIVLLASAPPLVAASLHRSFPWQTVLWLFFGAGCGEEIFYRGYIQSRVDEAWGQPWQLGGFQFGMGLVVSSLLFGLLHALNTVDYFHGRFDFGWRMGVQSIFVGAFFGLVRTRTGSVVTGAVIHGLGDVLDRLPNILRGSSAPGYGEP